MKKKKQIKEDIGCIIQLIGGTTGIVSIVIGVIFMIQGIIIGWNEPPLPDEGSFQHVELTEGHHKAGKKKGIGILLIVGGFLLVWKINKD